MTMTNYKIVHRIFIMLSLIVMSCSGDESTPKCQETNIVVSINGELLTFEAISRGISLTSDGYELTLCPGSCLHEPLPVPANHHEGLD
jgi:hypothetical protein